jgi:hypothetical protein
VRSGFSAALLAAIACACAASPSVAALPPEQDVVTGSGWVDDPRVPGFDGFILNIHAVSDPFGGNPTGDLRVDEQGYSRHPDQVQGTVTCMRVTGNRAILGFFGPGDSGDSGSGLWVGHHIGLVEVTDGGPTDKDVVRAMSDWYSVELVENSSGYYDFPGGRDPTWPKITTCPSALPRVDHEYTIPQTGFPIPDYVPPKDFVQVHDARPTPTSKDQCKNGGYVSFGFQNQGECVAFVERGPKPKP